MIFLGCSVYTKTCAFRIHRTCGVYETLGFRIHRSGGDLEISGARVRHERREPTAQHVVFHTVTTTARPRPARPDPPWTLGPAEGLGGNDVGPVWDDCLGMRVRPNPARAIASRDSGTSAEGKTFHSKIAEGARFKFRKKPSGLPKNIEEGVRRWMCILLVVF